MDSKSQLHDDMIMFCHLLKACTLTNYLLADTMPPTQTAAKMVVVHPVINESVSLPLTVGADEPSVADCSTGGCPISDKALATFMAVICGAKLSISSTFSCDDCMWDETRWLSLIVVHSSRSGKKKIQEKIDCGLTRDSDSHTHIVTTSTKTPRHHKTHHDFHQGRISPTLYHGGMSPTQRRTW